MTDRILTMERLTAYMHHLPEEARRNGTIKKYAHDMRAFQIWLDGKPVSQAEISALKACLMECGYKPVTINSMLGALNDLFLFLGWNDCRARFLKVQRCLFRETALELTRWEYECLLRSGQQGDQTQLALQIETICAIGIRVSEVRYITVETVRHGRAEVALKGKIRTILLPQKLACKLLQYAAQNKTACGEIFPTANGKGLSRRNIWVEMKQLCKAADMEASKVFPHILRHLFATTFYQVCKDIVQLADVLGHSSIETTRIYLITSGQEYARQLEKLRLVS